MPVPFSREVIAYAAELLSTPGCGSSVPSDALKLRFPELHPVLIAENLQWTEQLFGAASELAASVRAGALTPEQALDHLLSNHRPYPQHVVSRALDYALKSDQT